MQVIRFCSDGPTSGWVSAHIKSNTNFTNSSLVRSSNYTSSVWLNFSSSRTKQTTKSHWLLPVFDLERCCSPAGEETRATRSSRPWCSWTGTSETLSSDNSALFRANSPCFSLSSASASVYHCRPSSSSRPVVALHRPAIPADTGIIENNNAWKPLLAGISLKELGGQIS